MSSYRLSAEEEATISRWFAQLDDGNRYPMVAGSPGADFQWEPPPIIAGIRFDHCECDVCLRGCGGEAVAS
jgi:hypothetical protein